MLSFEKNSDKQYVVQCSLKSNTQSIDHWLSGFELFELVYSMHCPNVYESCNIEKSPTNTNVATITVVYKHFLQQFGLPQKFAKMFVEREQIRPDLIKFHCTPVPNVISPPNLVPINIHSMTITCTKSSEEFNCWQFHVICSKTDDEPEFVEKIIKRVLQTMYSNISAFFLQ